MNARDDRAGSAQGTRGLVGAALAGAAVVLFGGSVAAAPTDTAVSSPHPDPSYLPELLASARGQKLARSRMWQVLLHYRVRWSGGWRSEADGLGFFLAGAAGRWDPEAELARTLAAMFEPASATAPDEHVRCRFPARTAFLSRELAIDARRLPAGGCPLFESWRRAIGARGITLIYATAYMNSPASMYGHTFLRFSHADGGEDSLLDYAASFAADIDTRNGLAYAWKGLTGGFAGRFSVLPYYVKVQEYSSLENRDLWEYELSLSGAALDRLIAHLWETQTTYFDYYFFSRNCSYQLLTLLEVADPTLHLVDGFRGRVIPADTVRAVMAQPGLVRARRARPSLLSSMRRLRAALNGPEVSAAELWAASPGTVVNANSVGDTADLPLPRRALVLDAAYDYVRYQHGAKQPPDGAAQEAFERRERLLLLERGRLGVPSPVLDTRPSIDSPERGHATVRLGAGAGVDNEAGWFETLALRGAIHDYLDADAGYPEDAQLQMGNIRVRYINRDETPARGALRLDRLDVIDIFSAAPIERWTHQLSWRVWAGADEARELDCERPDSDRRGWRCLYAGLAVGTGLALRFGPRRAVLTYVLAGIDLGAGPAFARGGHYRVGGGGVIGATAAATSRLRFELTGQALFYALGERHDNFRARIATAVTVTERLALRLSVERVGSDGQVAAEVCRYY